ncbi:MAG: ribonuclease HIII [Erysipelotrichaceae bacterium]|nr:ribonuclease HIII [Erysipelotrichaceae bacterium]
METISLTLTDEQINKFYNVYKDFLVISKNQYIKYSFKLESCVVNIYTSNKAVFQGQDAKIYSASFSYQQDFKAQAGSDEVGTGDFFGPIIVVACIVDEINYQKIKDLGITDSKKITDNQILKMAPKLMELLPYTKLILSNKQYNEIIKDNNMNKIKARMHNQAYINLVKKGYKLPNSIIIDQFATPDNYYNYLINEPQIIKNITFKTKAEAKYIAVGAASIIARYIFLNEMDKMNRQYNFDFHKGAGVIVDQRIQAFIEKYSRNELAKVGKLNFKNYKKLEG